MWMGKTSRDTDKFWDCTAQEKAEENESSPSSTWILEWCHHWSSIHQHQKFVVASKEKQEEDGRKKQSEEPEL